MSRIIKFRGKYESGEWIKGNLVCYQEDDGEDVTCIVGDRRNKVDACVEFTPVDPETVGQFTALHDKNNRGIYEGDIVECVSWNEYFSKDGQPMEPFRRKMYVDFRKGAFVMVEPMPEPLQDHEWPIIYDGDIEVIGNIFDNPELIMIYKKYE